MILGLIPFYDGNNGQYAKRVAKTPKFKRLKYLKQTIDSLKSVCSTIMIGVCTKENESVVKELFGDNVIVVLFSDVDPKHLGSRLCTYAQQCTTESFYLYSDADHVWNINNLADLLLLVSDTSYVVPHRLEELYGNHGRNRGTIVMYNNKEYVLPNSVLNPNAELDSFKAVDNIFLAYGAGWICNRTLFRSIQFKYTNNLPGEQAAGFNIFETSQTAFKSECWFDFFVEHLSGLDYHKELSGEIVE